MPEASLPMPHPAGEELPPTPTHAIQILHNQGSWGATEALGKAAQILGALRPPD